MSDRSRGRIRVCRALRSWLTNAAQTKLAATNAGVARSVSPTVRGGARRVSLYRRNLDARSRHPYARDARAATKEAEDEPPLVRQIEDRVYFYCDVDVRSVFELHLRLDKACRWAEARGVDHVTLFVHSDGGCATPGWARWTPSAARACPWTVADGLTASAATFLLLAGHRRFALPHASVLVHQVSTELDGSLHQLARDVRHTEALMAMIERVYARSSTLEAAEITAMVREETIMLLPELVAFGFVGQGPP